MCFSGSFNLASGGLLWNEECWHLYKELKDIVMCIPYGRTRTLPQGCTIVSWLLLLCLCVPSLPCLATVWICPLGLREGHGGFPCRGAPQGPAWFYSLWNINQIMLFLWSKTSIGFSITHRLKPKFLTGAFEPLWNLILYSLCDFTAYYSAPRSLYSSHSGFLLPQSLSTLHFLFPPLGFSSLRYLLGLLQCFIQVFTPI